MSLALGDVVPIEPKIVEAKRIAVNDLAAASEKFTNDMQAWAGWFLVAVHSRSERTVAKAMLEAGVRVWVPMCDEERVLKPDRRGGKRPRKKKKTIVSKPTFPGYIAVWIVPSAQSWNAISNFDRVIGLVVSNPESWSSNSAATRLHHALSDKMITRIEGIEAELHKKDSAFSVTYSVGETINIIEGPFHGFPAVVTFFNKELVVLGVEVEIFGRATPVELELDQIEKCS